MKKVLISCFIFFLNFVYSQKEASQWHFTYLNGLNFLTSPPTSFNTSSISANEGCASLADSAGNLLFYTNGWQVWNKQNNLMTGSLPGSPSSMQAAVCARKSGSKYYAFTTGSAGTGALSYSIIDMNLAGGLGDVVSSVQLRANVSERLAATKHCNGRDTWFVVHPMGTNTFEAYLAGPNSVTTTPVISSVGPALTYTDAAFGTLKFSPNGKKLVLTSPSINPNNSFVTIFNFDNSTGIVSSQTLLATFQDYWCMTTEFSPDATKLYGALAAFTNAGVDPNFICQWDLCAGSSSAIAASSQSVATFNYGQFWTGLQLAIDGKIYYNLNMLPNNNVGYIAQPNLSGINCAVSSQTLPINPNGLSGSFFPNFVSTSFRPKSTFSHTVNCGLASFSPEVLDPCVSAADPILARTWFFGDQSSNTNSTTITNPQHGYSANGSYPVKMVLQYNCHTDTIEKIIQITSLPSLSLTGKASICAGESVTYTLSGANTYTFNNSVTSTTISLSPPVTSTFAVSGSNQNCQASKQFTVTVKACTGVEEENQNHFIQVYPNPSSGTFILHSEQAGYYYLYSATSRLLQEGLFSKGLQQLEIGEQKAGVYFLRVQVMEREYVIKLLVE